MSVCVLSCVPPVTERSLLLGHECSTNPILESMVGSHPLISVRFGTALNRYNVSSIHYTIFDCLCPP